jgi:hypothetical protein
MSSSKRKILVKHPEIDAGKTYHLGYEARSYREIAEILTRVIGQRPSELARLREQGDPRPGRGLRQLFRADPPSAHHLGRIRQGTRRRVQALIPTTAKLRGDS